MKEKEKEIEIGKNQTEWEQEDAIEERNTGDEYEFLEDFEDEEELDLTPSPYKKWMIRILAFIVSVALIVNVLAFLPTVINIPALQFLKTSNMLSKQEAIQEYKQAVVIVETNDSKGTGFNISPEGLIVTNHHVIQNHSSVIVRFPDGSAYRSEPIASHEEYDVAILQVQTETDELPVLKLKEQYLFTDSEPIYFIGNPLSFSQIANEGTIVEQVHISEQEKSVLIIDANVYRGNSGSPVIDHEGEVIGVVYAMSEYTVDHEKKKVGLAVPVAYVHEVLGKKN
ncbi:S1 family peptidase [Caldalkalibacillus mannanilyticus]|uniref:S1 family peptidase n=1 Tax=Caldalkalibacillus mannanilyticus TaxID=1418 RepID=UPI00046A569D|nr:serine protease [Caldalkalibacillus mannanilyticus]